MASLQLFTNILLLILSLAEWRAVTCVNELDVSLQVSVDHEDLVAAGMWTGSLPHLLVMLLYVFLQRDTFSEISS